MGALGTAAKVLHVAFLAVVTRLYDPAAVGVFLLGRYLLDMLLGLAIHGIKDGIVVYGGRADPDTDEGAEALHRVVSTGLIVSAVITALVFAFGVSIVEWYFSFNASSSALGEQVVALLPVLVWAIPAIAIAEVTVSATKALLTMTYDTLLLGFARPALMLVCAVVVWFIRPDTVGLVLAFVIAQSIVALLGVWAFARHFSLGRLLRALLRPKLDRELLRFSVPQGINITFGTFITRVDVLMLGFFGVAAPLVAFYGTASEIVRNIRQGKLAFSGAFAPIIARLWAQRAVAELESRFAMVSRWATMIAMPASIAVLVLRQELLLIFDETYVYDSTFMYVLVVVPVLSCWVGLAGNLVAMTGHNRWNLLNAVVVAVVNTALNAVLIPAYGLMGAAIGTAFAGAAVTALQLWEAKFLLGVGFRIGESYKPLLAGAVGGLAAAGVAFAGDHLVVHVVAAVVGVAVFVLGLRRLGLDPRDADLFRLRKPKIDAAPPAQ